MKRSSRGTALYISSLILGVLLGAAAYLVFSLVTRVTLNASGPGSRAVVLDQSWSDWFSQEATLEEQKEYLDTALDTIQTMGADSVLWAARTSSGEALFRDRSGEKLELAAGVAANNSLIQKFDPLKYLVEGANHRGMSVNLLATDQDGAVLDYSQTQSSLSPSVSWAAQRYGLLLCAPAPSQGTGSEYTQLGDRLETYYFYPASGKGQETLLWGLRCDDSVEALAAALTEGSLDGTVILGNYSGLSQRQEEIALFTSWTTSIGSGAPNLTAQALGGKSQSTALAITYPNTPNKEGSYTITTDTCFLMGTSDPSQSLTISGNGIEGQATVERFGAKGAWGYQVLVYQGNNTFTLTQEDGTTTQIVLYKPAPSGGGSYTPPQADDSQAALPGQRLQITDTIASALSDPTNSDSISQTLYKGAIAQVVASKQITFGGKLTYAYQLSTGDWVRSSTCQLLDMESSQRLMTSAEFQDQLEATRTAIAKEKGVKESKVTEEEIMERLGLYVEEQVSTVGNAAFTGITVSQDAETNCQVLTFEGTGTPAVYHNWEGNVLSLTFLDAGFSGEVPGGDGFVTQYQASAQGSNFILTMTFGEDNPLWGWCVEYDTEANVTKIYLKKTPVLSQAATGPLTGVRVLLDPGHGGDDGGAMGTAGYDAPIEKELNLAVALAAKYRLEQLGATVLMTRSDDTYLTLDQRLEAIEDLRPDFFISLHHNSTALTGDANQSKGTEAYWFYTEGQPLAAKLVANVCEVTGRQNRGDNYDYYFVTRTNLCPSVLLETGFICNPGEYESVSDPTTLWAEGAAVARAVLESVSG